MANPQFTEAFDFTSDLQDDANWDVEDDTAQDVVCDGDAAYVEDLSTNNKSYVCVYNS